jgi:hypothetical protein
MSRWHRLRRLHQGEQSFATEPYKTEEVVDPAPDLAGEAQQLRHAREQIALAGQYPGRARSMPSGAKAIELDTGKPKA